MLFLLGSVLFVPKSAYAATTWPSTTFTYQGRTYPSTLVGVTVTFNAHPSDPASYMGLSGGNIMWYAERYYAVGAFIAGGTTSVPLNGEYVQCESTASASPSHPWFIYFNESETQTNPNVFYDGYSTQKTWYNPYSGGTGGTPPTVTFAYGSSLADQTLYGDLPLLYQQDFIRYVVDNSDFRSRYTLTAGSWSNASYSYSDPVLTWNVPSGNMNYNLSIYYGTSTSDWSQIRLLQSQSGSGSITLTDSGYYKLDFTYVINGVPTTQTIITSYLTVAGSNPLVLSDLQTGWTSSKEFYVYAQFENPQPTYVYLQMLQNGSYVNVYGLHLETSGDFSGYWALPGPRPLSSGTYQLLVQRTGEQDVSISLGNIQAPSGGFDYGIFGDVAGYVQSFVQNFGNVFGWLPAELSGFLQLAVIAMIVLGIVQLVKP